MKRLRILLADDHAVLRDGLKSFIDAEPDMEVVAEAADGDEACHQAEKFRPDVVIMDLAMPRCDGAQAALRLGRLCPETKVLALTMHGDAASIRRLLKAGVAGCVLKESAADELTQAIRQVAAGEVYLQGAVADTVVRDYVEGRERASAPEAALSDRETEVLRLTAWGHSNKEIATRLDVSVKTVETYKGRAMDKLRLRSRAEVVRLAVERGWMSEEG